VESQACLSIPQRPAARGSERVLAYGHTLLSSATAELSRDVRSYLKHPDKLFRRVRDERDNLTPAITGDATLAVVYEQDAPSEVASARAGQATVTVVDDGVVIAHAEPQSRCVVYASNGQPVVSTVIEGDSQKIRLQKGQVYILTINGRTLKFAL